MRVLLYLLANFSILVVLSISLRLLGVEAALTENGYGVDLNSLLIFAAVLGFGGSLISLAISKWMAKRSMGVQLIETPRSETERWLLNTVRQQAEKAGIGMPEVGIFPSPAPNAFATGMNKNNALVAVSVGLLEHMDRNEVEAVLGHEVSHVANGDMVTMGLLQGVLNTFVIFFSRIIGTLVDRVVFKNERGRGPGFWVATIVAELILGVLASIVAMWFSRRREFRADIGGADLAGGMKMIAALRALQRGRAVSDMPAQMAALGINGGFASGLKKLFMSHPPLEERIQALEQDR